MIVDIINQGILFQIMDCKPECKCMFCFVPEQKIEKKRMDITWMANGIMHEAHGYAIVKTEYWSGGSLTCMIGFEPDKK